MRKSSMWVVSIAVSLILTLRLGAAYAQESLQAGRYALVVGNSTYSELGNLKNPGNDATDIANALYGLGFDVNLLLDADLVQMEDAVTKLGIKLSGAPSSIGFFYYAGHSVQSNGVNYLIPADARIQDEAYLRIKALAAQSVLDVLQRASNSLNVVILDACRDNPFGWARSGSRGLSVVGNQPPGSIVVYATSAGSTALDGIGRNSVFTTELLKNLPVLGLEIKEIFNRTGAGVVLATAGKQTPAVYNQFFGEVFLTYEPNVASPGNVTISSQLSGSLLVRANVAGTLYLDGMFVGDIRKSGAKRLSDLEVGYYELEIRYSTGDRESRNILISEGKETEVLFVWKTSVLPPTTTTSTTTIAQQKSQGFVDMVFIKGGTFMMGSDTGNPDQKPVHTVTVSSFFIGKYEVTQEQYQKVMGTNPSYFKNGLEAPRRPVEQVSWFDAVNFCNKLSELEGLQKVYSIVANDVRADFSMNGYCLPTEAEWEYAARGGSLSGNYIYAGSNNTDNIAWYFDNSVSTTHAVGIKLPNELRLYDMSGNVWEWCWDYYSNSYTSNILSNPHGPTSGFGRVIRGGSWIHFSGMLVSTYRNFFGPIGGKNYLGFRIVRRP